MALTPINYVTETEETTTAVESVVTQIEPSLTFKLGQKRLGGLIDGKEAVEQFIQKAIKTTRWNYLIYEGDYGCELGDLLSQSLPFSVLEVEIPRLIEDALIYDDRIESVSEFALSQKDDGLYISFIVGLTDGESIASEVIL